LVMVHHFDEPGTFKQKSHDFGSLSGKSTYEHLLRINILDFSVDTYGRRKYPLNSRFACGSYERSFLTRVIDYEWDGCKNDD
jgi:hypothetical protein